MTTGAMLDTESIRSLVIGSSQFLFIDIAFLSHLEVQNGYYGKIILYVLTSTYQDW